ncbi:IS3 family transposase [Anaerococcus sp. AGMB00486]|uniref:IS3 family transposase n=2 Tax=Anaerococcus TaxID=165779 RepID=A0ABX2N885_9FIRM|nr:transposase [Anaerococcus porci]NVF10910.1 IS3 family transposase [Anaerococcus faecalis]
MIILFCESFFKFLKKECTNRRSYESLDELRTDLFDKKLY